MTHLPGIEKISGMEAFLVTVLGKSKPPAARCATLKAGCDNSRPSFLGLRVVAKAFTKNRWVLCLQPFQPLASSKKAATERGAPRSVWCLHRCQGLTRFTF